MSRRCAASADRRRQYASAASKNLPSTMKHFLMYAGVVPQMVQLRLGVSGFCIQEAVLLSRDYISDLKGPQMLYKRQVAM